MSYGKQALLIAILTRFSFQTRDPRVGIPLSWSCNLHTLTRNDLEKWYHSQISRVALYAFYLIRHIQHCDETRSRFVSCVAMYSI